jgi:hypothetical protein
MNHPCHDWNKRMITIIQNTSFNHRARWLPLVNEKFAINELVTISMVFFGLGVMNDAAKPNCILPIGDDGFLNGGCSSSKLIVIKINTESEYNSNLQIGMELSIK